MHSYIIFNKVLITLFGCTKKFSVEWKKKTLVQKRESQVPTHPITTFQTATVQNYMYVTGVSNVSNNANSFQLGQETYDHLNQHCSKLSDFLLLPDATQRV
jgi:hypothetical protein